MIPHITDEIKSFISSKDGTADFVLCEIGGTVGDIEGLPFLEAIRQFQLEVGTENVVIMHVTLLFGGLLLAKTGQPLAGLILLVLVKIVMDVRLHRREHARLQDIV